MIRYKVVISRNRGSCSIEEGCKYRKVYKRGKIVKAKKGTLGIFCFKTKIDAINFIHGNEEGGYFSIIKIKPIGKGKKPKLIASIFPFLGADIMINDFYRHSGYILNQESPEGTICYPAVRVLD